MLVAWICGVTCLRNALAGHFTSVAACKFQSFYMVAAIGANAWINLMVTRQLYRMLWAARHFRPTPQLRPHAECLGVYCYALFLATLGMFDVPWWPHKTRLTIGSACIPMDYDTKSTLFFYLIFFPLLFGIPLAYVCWAAYTIWRQQLLPPSGSRRVLAIYFFRIAAVFLIMWLPGLLLLFVTAAWLDPWVQWAGGAWSHLQGLVSAVVSLWKPDVWQAVKWFWTTTGVFGGGCCGGKTNDIDGNSNHIDTSGDCCRWKRWWGNLRQKPRCKILITAIDEHQRRKPRWASDSVYWSPHITMGGGEQEHNGPNEESPSSTKPSFASSYHEGEDDLEQMAAAKLSCLDGKCNILVSDDSEFQTVLDDDDGNRLASIAEEKDDNDSRQGVPHSTTEVEANGVPSDLEHQHQPDHSEDGAAPYKAIYIVSRSND